MNRSKTFELNLNIQFGRAVYSQFLPARKIIESAVLFNAQKIGTEIIPSCLFISSRLKKSTYGGEIKIFLSRFLSHPILYKQPLSKVGCNFSEDESVLKTEANRHIRNNYLANLCPLQNNKALADEGLSTKFIATSPFS